jgi:hypothetical protein
VLSGKIENGDYLLVNGNTMNMNKEIAAGRTKVLLKKVEEVRHVVEAFNEEAEAGKSMSYLAQAQIATIAERGRAYLSELAELEKVLKS